MKATGWVTPGIAVVAAIATAAAAISFTSRQPAKEEAMSEETMMALVQQALDRDGFKDEVTAVGEFYPRGHTGGLFAGIMIGGDIGEAFGGVGKAVGLAVGSLAGMKAADTASGLPGKMLIGVSEKEIYGLQSKSRNKEPEDLVFNMPRERTEVKVHKRVNVRVLELIDEASGARVELEGNRVPMTHSKDVIAALVH
jgi:uncharacterized protein YcfJ